MTQEEKSLLLQDLCARLPYVLYATVRDPEEKDDFQPFEVLGIKEDLVWVKNTMIGVDHFDTIEVVKPYLRPMSSMTEEEKEFIQSSIEIVSCENYDDWYSPSAWDAMNDFVNYCDSHYLDHRGLIWRGLALEAPEGMYKIN